MTTPDGETASHTYAAPGFYTISLTATDENGLTGTTSQEVEINWPPPVPAFTFVVDRIYVDFDGSNSTADTGATVIEWSWDFGDGSDPVVDSTPLVHHRFPTAGDYTVSLSVTDDRSEISPDPATEIVTIPLIVPIWDNTDPVTTWDDVDDAVTWDSVAFEDLNP